MLPIVPPVTKLLTLLNKMEVSKYLCRVNFNGIYNVSGHFSFGLPFKKMQNANFNTTTRVDYGRNASLIKNSTNFVNDFAVIEEFSLNYNYEEKLDVGINTSITYNAISYTVRKAQNTSYFTHSYSVDATYTFPHDFILSTTADYTTYKGRSGGFNQNYVTWNASLSKQLFRSKGGKLKLIVNDILNQNVNVSRNVLDNYIEDVQNTTLRRLVMLMFTYNLNQTQK